ncbi:MAG TPA: RHS repeat-associated core domain-containing protein [Streptosporangiaceae bacterium]|nr:RHS repeat-associated core domain-containing protein [Streptosporangiaceae bacterium]
MAAATSVAMVAPFLTGAMPPPAYKGRLWLPDGHRPAKEKSVPGYALPVSAWNAVRIAAWRSLPKEPGQVRSVRYRSPERVIWPAGTGTASFAQVRTVRRGKLVSQEARWLTGPRPAGSLPATVSAAEPRGAAAAAGSVRVTVAGQRPTARAGIHGVMLTVSGHGALAAGGQVTVRLDYRQFAKAYGGSWDSRLYLAEVPACALTTPAAPGCGARYRVPGGNDTKTDTLWARVRLPGPEVSAVPPLLPGSSGTRPRLSAQALVSTPALVLATETAPGGSDGTYAATSLSPSGSWSVQDGNFTYDYPITVPASLGGSAPRVSLHYDAQSIDGETSGSNTQGGLIGDGWDYSPGYIERSYQPCSETGVSGLSQSDDLCFDGYNATLSLAGHSSMLVRSGTNGSVQTYHLAKDDGTQVQLLQDGSNGPNGVWDNEYWVVTTTDGTKYYFGANHVPGYSSSPATNSAWGEPVYNPVSGNPCYSSAAGIASWCTMGYRWNLDFVADPRGNLTEYDYATETNYYNRGAGQASSNVGTLTQYVRDGYPVSARYGMLLSDEQKATPVKPAAQVIFGYAQRCVPVGSTTCGSYANLNSSTAADWPDTPFPNICQSTGSCSNWGPTYFSTYRLATITTEVLPSQSSTSYSKVDTYALSQSYPSGSTAGPVMFLNSILRTGNDGGTTALPAVTFTAAEMDNRVQGSTATPVDRPRIEAITTEAGEEINVYYRPQDCTQGSGGNVPPAEPDANTLACYPVYWTPPGVNQGQIEDWFNKTLVSQVTLQDLTGAGSPQQVSDYTYLGNAAWHWDESPVIPKASRLYDDFRGYQQVETQVGVAPDPVTETIDTYLRGMYGDETSSGGTTTTTVTDPNGDVQNDYNWLSGEVMEADSYNLVNGVQTIEKKNISRWSDTAFTQTAAQSQPSSSGLSALTADMVTQSQTEALLLQADGQTYKSDTNTDYYNSKALPAYSDHAPQGLTETCTMTSYAIPPSQNPMMEDYPAQVTTVAGAYSTTAGACPAATSSNLIGDSKTFYDDKTSTLSTTGMGTLKSLAYPGGLITGTQSASSWPSGGSEQWQPETVTSYDSYGYGRAVSNTDANGNTSTISYSPASQALPTSVTDTNPAPFHWQTKTTLNQGRQEATAVTDVNGEVTSETHDGLGRLTSVTTPIDQGTGYATYTYSYHLDGKTPPAVTTSTLREDGSYSRSISIYDGFAQLRQVQATPADNSAGRVITDIFYESHGWDVKKNAPYYDSTTSPDTTLFVANDNQVPSQTVTGYDEMGRATSQSLYSLGTFQWQTSKTYLGMNQVDSAPAPGGSATTTIGNVLGQETQSWVYDDSSVPTDQASDAVVTGYGYNATGQSTSVTDANGNTWSYGYNLLGQQTSVTDPGTGTAGPSGQAGTTAYAYDPDGNLLKVTDQMNNVITYSYDTLNRKTAEYDDTTGTPVEVASWQYDTLAKGHLTSSTVYDSSGQAYTEAITGLNAAYEPSGTAMTVPSDAGALASSTASGSITQYTTQVVYTPLTGLPEYTAYTGDGHLPAEVVNYTYDLEGLLTQYGSGTPYLDNTTFTPQGQVASATFGPYGKQLVQDYSYDAGTDRMLGSVTSLQTLTQPADVTNYTYDPSGNITSVSDQQDATSGQPVQLQCFAYNHSDELTQAWTDAGTTATAPEPEVSGIGGCADTSPAATSVGGIQPYWQQYSFDALGDRTQEITHDTASVAQDTTANETTQQIAFTGANTTTTPYTQATGTQGQPDAAQSIAAAGPGGTAATTNTYNSDGQLTKIATTTTGAAPPAAPPGATFKYNAEGEVSSATTSAGTTSYLYDASGNLLLQSGPTATTLYVDGGAEQITATGSTLSGLRFFGNSPDGTSVVESSGGTVSYQLANQQGTALESVSASTLAITRRYYDPWGNQVGTPPAWPDNHGFLGKVTDPATGFSLLGPREYDPVTGSFTSLDPVLESGDSRQMGGYAYAADNPATGSDPSGLMPCLPGGPCGSIQWLEHYTGGQSHSPAPAPAQSPSIPSIPGLPAFLNGFGGFGGHLVGPSWQYTIITLGPVTVVDNQFVTIKVKFSESIGHDTGSTVSVNLGSNGMAESTSVKLPDGVTATFPVPDLTDANPISGAIGGIELEHDIVSKQIAGFDCTMAESVSLDGEITLKLTWSTDQLVHGFTVSGELDVMAKAKRRAQNNTQAEDSQDQAENKSKKNVSTSEDGVKFTTVSPFGYSPIYSFAFLNGIGDTAGVLGPSTEKPNMSSLANLFGQPPGTGQSPFQPVINEFPQVWTASP